MKHCLFSILGFIVFSSATQALAWDSSPVRRVGQAPVFADFPATPSHSAQKYAAKVILTTPRSRRYRTAISREGRKAPDFAGIYRLVTWGCGTDCLSFAIVNRINGVVYTPSSFGWLAGVMGNTEPRVQHRKDSRLLILTGALDDDEKREGTYFYEWTVSD